MSRNAFSRFQIDVAIVKSANLSILFLERMQAFQVFFEYIFICHKSNSDILRQLKTVAGLLPLNLD